MKRRLWLSALPAFLYSSRGLAQDASASQAASAAAAAPLRYVAVSLIADKITHVFPGRSTGTLIHSGQHEDFPMPNRPYDRSALSAIATELQQIKAGAPASFLMGNSPDYYTDQDDWFAHGRVKLPERLQQHVAGENANRLLLLTKVTSEAHLTDGSNGLSLGRISGLGVYLDPYKEGWNTTTNTRAQGFSAPFANVRLTLIDVETSTVLRDRSVQVSHPFVGRLVDESAALERVLAEAVHEAMVDVFKEG